MKNEQIQIELDAPCAEQTPPVKKDRLMLTEQQRSNFEDKIDKSDGPDGCWIWTGAQAQGGYGAVSIKHKTQKSHRVSYQLYHGEIPEGMCVCHSCDTPLCQNPKHLWAGTHADNVKDKEIKGRGRRLLGSNNHWTKLTEEDVRSIRRMVDKENVPQTEVALAFGVSTGCIWWIVHRRAWAHIV